MLQENPQDFLQIFVHEFFRKLIHGLLKGFLLTFLQKTLRHSSWNSYRNYVQISSKNTSVSKSPPRITSYFSRNSKKIFPWNSSKNFSQNSAEIFFNHFFSRKNLLDETLQQFLEKKTCNLPKEETLKEIPKGIPNRIPKKVQSKFQRKILK